MYVEIPGQPLTGDFFQKGRSPDLIRTLRQCIRRRSVAHVTGACMFRKKEYLIETDPACMPDTSFSAAVISDLHDGTSAEFLRDLAQALREERPALVLCTGDQVTARDGRCRMSQALRFLMAVSGRYPLYCIDGNHERRLDENRRSYGDAYDVYTEKLKKAGAHLINNRSEYIRQNGMLLRISGYSPGLNCYRRTCRKTITEEMILEKLGPCENDGAFQILLCHIPDDFPSYARWGADLTLSGHVHGGIVRLPLLGGIFGSTLRPFPKYDRGLYTTNDGRKMIVSAGLGSHTIPLRINNPRELIVLKFRGRESM